MNRNEILESWQKNTWPGRVSRVTSQIAISGSLSTNLRIQSVQVEQWKQVGITDVIELWANRSSQFEIRIQDPKLTIHRFPAPKSEGPELNNWFFEVTKFIRYLVAKNRSVLLTCELGSDSAPTAAFRYLIDVGIRPLPAAKLVRAVRPSATLRNAAAALRNFHGQTSPKYSDDLVDSEVRTLNDWIESHPVEESMLKFDFDNEIKFALPNPPPVLSPLIRVEDEDGFAKLRVTELSHYLVSSDVKRIAHYGHPIPIGRGFTRDFVNENYPGWEWGTLMGAIRQTGAYVANNGHGGFLSDDYIGILIFGPHKSLPDDGSIDHPLKTLRLRGN